MDEPKYTVHDLILFLLSLTVEQKNYEVEFVYSNDDIVINDETKIIEIG